jgi:protein involved in polysaccharide export with SLBB domain
MALIQPLLRRNRRRTRCRGRPTATAQVLAGIGVIVLILTGCASRFAPSDTPLPPANPPGSVHPISVTSGDVLEVGYFFTSKTESRAYRIGVGDVLSVTVADHPKLQRDEVVVLPDGTVSFPLIGSLPAVGQTVQELADDAARAYNREWLRDPRVVISVVKGQQRLRQFMQYVGVDRGVNKLQFTVFDNQPIELPLIPPVAIERPLSVIRNEIREAYALEFGDQVAVTVNLVKRVEPMLYVMGEVLKPGAVPLTRPTNLLTAIATAGGFAETADQGAVLVVRFSPEGSYDYWTFDFKKGLFSEGTPASFYIRNNDVVYVARSPIANVDLFVKQYIRGLLPIDVGAGIPLGRF